LASWASIVAIAVKLASPTLQGLGKPSALELNPRSQFRALSPFSSASTNMAVTLAHVKWFSHFDWATQPRGISEITTLTFWAMLALSVAVLIALVFADRWVESLPAGRRLSAWFETYSASSLLVMRVAAFATLLVAWQLGTLFAPELEVHNPWTERLQFLIILFLFWERTTPLAGLGIFGLWLTGLKHFGFFHMLDYVNILGVAYFLTVRPLTKPLLRETALPVLYATLGVSLMWLGCEKLVYPQWVTYIFEQNPILTLGLDTDFFRVAAAFVELGLGFLLIIGLFGRSLSIIITLTFFCTTMVFGKVEIIGHTLIHAALLVFLFEGPGHSFRPPAYFHRGLGLRMAFASVNFVIAVFVALLAYTTCASYMAANASHSPPAERHAHEQVDATAGHDHPLSPPPAESSDYR
jgi:uncharacterized membrane protein YphA (DoxX/SURF4 family)